MLAKQSQKADTFRTQLAQQLEDGIVELFLSKEINGDNINGIINRSKYLALNLIKNLKPARKLKLKKFSTSHFFRTPDCVDVWSPGRGFAENFITHFLPEIVERRKVCSPNDVSILDVGCGSGRSVDLFVKSGFSGSWEGIDIDDRFINRENKYFSLAFSQNDILKSQFEPKFDIIYSNSALEHIPASENFPKKLQKWLKPNGIQVHIVPAPTALPLYLWHGWRQYSLHRLERDFEGNQLEVYPIGGFFSSFLHFVFITFWENILGVSPRERFPKMYKWLLFRASKADRFAPFFPVFYAVIVSHNTKSQNSN